MSASAQALLSLNPNQLKSVLEAEIEARSLKAFVRGAWHIHHGEIPLDWNWHIDVICDHLVAVLPGRRIKRLIINVPPGFLKSLLVSVYWPAWLWVRYPKLQVLAASSANDVALRDAKRMHEIIGSEWFRRFGLDYTFDRGQDAKGYFANTEGGYRISRSTGQKVIGFRGDLNLTDDPLDAKDAYGDKAELVAHVKWYQQSWRTRVNSPIRTPLVIIMQRLHEMDLSGVLLKQPGWQHLCIPNEYDGVRRRTILGEYDPRQTEGELLHPVFLDAETTENLKGELGSLVYSAQYQQNPKPAEGTIIHAEWIRYYDIIEEKPAEFDYIVHSWDTAQREMKWADWSVGQVWGVLGANRYLLDQVRARLDTPKLIKAIRTMCEIYPVFKAVLVEGRNNGPEVVRALRSEIPGLIAINPDTSKEARLAACAPLFESGNILVPYPEQKPWGVGLLDELLAFPASAYKDQVDALTQALNWIRENEVKEPWFSHAGGNPL